MDAYIYAAALYCSDCAATIKRDKVEPGHVRECDESSYDSGEWPKGPYPRGGGESDTPSHCDGCGVFLENPLASGGIDYVLDARPGPVRDMWLRFYRLEG